jgi:hypothetical protein
MRPIRYTWFTEETLLAAQKKPTVAEYLAAQIALSGKSQADIAREVGYDRGNVVNMMKQGTLKLPITKVGPFAKALGVDPVHLLRLTLGEYMPETMAAMEEIVGRALVTENEQRMLEVIRKAAAGRDVQLNREQERLLSEIVREAAKAAR